MPLFLIIADGAVNDYTKSRGFWSETTDVSAWDCLVGCNDGLVKLKKIFNKGIKKTITEPIYLPYRNGILHGRCLNYDNKYVSSKCLALLFVIADWINMDSNEETRKIKLEKELNPPPLRDTLNQIQKNNLDKLEITNWQPKKIMIGKDIPSSGDVFEYQNYPFIAVVIEMLYAWKKNNYGELSNFLEKLFSYEENIKIRPKLCRELFENKNLISWEITDCKEKACSQSSVDIFATWESNNILCNGTLKFGCTYLNDSGKTSFPWDNDGAWKIHPWDITALYKN